MPKAPINLRRVLVATVALVSSNLLAQPVLADCAAADAAHHFDADDGQVRQARTGLEWQRCSIGQHYDDGHCHGAASAMTWAAAQQAAAQAGHGWRLPTNAELQGLLIPNCGSPATDTRAFPGTASGPYWTASGNGSAGAWFVDFSGNGGNGATLASTSAAVRLVRTHVER